MALEGGGDLRNVSLRLRAAGEVGLRRAMFRNIRLATAPAVERVRQSARATLPKGGGLNEYIADSTIRTNTRTTGRSVGVTLRLPKHRRAIDAGVVRHPVYGNPKAWTATKVEPGFWSKPLEEMQPQVYAACQAVMVEVSIQAGFRSA